MVHIHIHHFEGEPPTSRNRFDEHLTLSLLPNHTGTSPHRDGPSPPCEHLRKPDIAVQIRPDSRTLAIFFKMMRGIHNTVQVNTIFFFTNGGCKDSELFFVGIYVSCHVLVNGHCAIQPVIRLSTTQTHTHILNKKVVSTVSPNGDRTSNCVVTHSRENKTVYRD